MENIDFEDALRVLYDNLEYDGRRYYLHSYCVSEGDKFPSFEEFIDFIKERSKTK